MERTLLFRSRDGGKTWSEPEKLDKTTLQELEDVLLQADLGLPMAERIVKAVATGRYDKEIDPEEVKRILSSEVAKVLKPVEVPFNFGTEKPYIILVVGVNGAGASCSGTTT